MAKYILDTNTVSYLWDETSIFHNIVVDNLSRLNENDVVGMTMVTFYELKYGIESIKDKSKQSKFRFALHAMQSDKSFEIYNLSCNGADFFSLLKNQYRLGTGITAKDIKKDNLDFLIASVALSENAILISGDRIFSKIHSLNSNFRYKNWFK